MKERLWKMFVVTLMIGTAVGVCFQYIWMMEHYENITVGISLGVIGIVALWFFSWIFEDSIPDLPTINIKKKPNIKEDILDDDTTKT